MNWLTHDPTRRPLQGGIDQLRGADLQPCDWSDWKANGAREIATEKDPAFENLPPRLQPEQLKSGLELRICKTPGVGASLTQDSNCGSYARADGRFHLAETPIVVHNRARGVGKLSATLSFHSFVAMVRRMAFNLERVEPLNPSRSGGKE